MLRLLFCMNQAPPKESVPSRTSPYFQGTTTEASNYYPSENLIDGINRSNKLRRMYNITANIITYSYKLAHLLYYIFTILYYGFCLIALYIIWIYFTKLTNQVNLIYQNFSNPYS
ncbi:ORF3b [Alphamesonivirus daknongense]|uniref:ORF3b n=1 Tax=Alphamesonivirus daknongense TaxID=1945561 RepID=M4JU04_9NIDO|nr:ORF3b [Alphamesonivirus 3]AGE00060.1 ORF3b [Alphamesonivirus 3]